MDVSHCTQWIAFLNKGFGTKLRSQAYIARVLTWWTFEYIYMYIHMYTYMYVGREVCVPRQKPNQHGATFYFLLFFKFPFLFWLLWGWMGEGRTERERKTEKKWVHTCKQASAMSVWYMHMCMFRYTLEWRPDKHTILYHFHLFLKAGSLTKSGAVSQGALKNLLSLSSKITEIIGMHRQLLHGY